MSQQILICTFTPNSLYPKIKLMRFRYGRGHSSARYGQGRGHILMDDVRCNGNETSLKQCRQLGWGRHNCDHSKDAGVECSSNHLPSDKFFRSISFF
jgi:hypothetical protein